jgi:hypothetical protein
VKRLKHVENCEQNMVEGSYPRYATTHTPSGVEGSSEGKLSTIGRAVDTTGR